MNIRELQQYAYIIENKHEFSVEQVLEAEESAVWLMRVVSNSKVSYHTQHEIPMIEYPLKV